jgi:hypothetical protein
MSRASFGLRQRDHVFSRSCMPLRTLDGPPGAACGRFATISCVAVCRLISCVSGPRLAQDERALLLGSQP